MGNKTLRALARPTLADYDEATTVSDFLLGTETVLHLILTEAFGPPLPLNDCTKVDVSSSAFWGRLCQLCLRSYAAICAASIRAAFAAATGSSRRSNCRM